jgi:NAD(P)-dependent dehydrogenase (short-subunit alcohol dehydrogenase family)
MDRWALVTGAGGGIGEGIARVLAAEGWTVAVNDINADSAKQVAEEIGGVAVPGDVDASSAELVATVIDAAKAAGGEFRALVNNAGIVLREALATAEVENLDRAYRINLRAPLRLSQAALPHLKENKGENKGAIVNISSIAAVSPLQDGGLYTASKAGLAQLTRQAAVEWGPLGVRVNSIAPGMIRTRMSADVWADPAQSEQRRKLIPLGRTGEPADIGRAVAFLISDAAGFITGQLITVDGGFTQVLLDQMPHTATLH